MQEITSYSVVVGNVGTVYQGPSLHESLDCYEYYVRMSRQEGFRASGEDVTAYEHFADQSFQPSREYFGSANRY